MRRNVTRADYGRLADRYDENRAHSPGFVHWMTDGILSRLSTGDGRLMIDLECGTGPHSRRLGKGIGIAPWADPSAAMSECFPVEACYRCLPVPGASPEPDQAAP